MSQRGRRVVVVGFEGATTLDVTGPAEVFGSRETARHERRYRVELAAVGGGMIGTSSSLKLQTRDLLRIRPQADDTVVVVGGEEEAMVRAMNDDRLVRWIGRAASRVERMTSVCSGAFLLAAAGVLDERRATTHWRGCERLAQMFPQVSVDPNAIFVRDGTVWTSAGVTTGIDMALAIVEDDFGRATADSIAASLVLYLRRPGFQSQFSNALVSQLDSSDPLGRVVAWIRENLNDADVESAAQVSGLSVRSFHRRVREQMGTTPAKLIEKVRVEHARTLLATSDLPAKALAASCGFGNATNMKRAFEREIGVGPREYRLLHVHA